MLLTWHNPALGQWKIFERHDGVTWSCACGSEPVQVWHNSCTDVRQATSRHDADWCDEVRSYMWIAQTIVDRHGCSQTKLRLVKCIIRWAVLGSGMVHSGLYMIAMCTIGYKRCKFTQTNTIRSYQTNTLVSYLSEQYRPICITTQLQEVKQNVQYICCSRTVY